MHIKDLEHMNLHANLDWFLDYLKKYFLQIHVHTNIGLT